MGGFFVDDEATSASAGEQIIVVQSANYSPGVTAGTIPCN